MVRGALIRSRTSRQARLDVREGLAGLVKVTTPGVINRSAISQSACRQLIPRHLEIARDVTRDASTANHRRLINKRTVVGDLWKQQWMETSLRLKKSFRNCNETEERGGSNRTHAITLSCLS